MWGVLDTGMGTLIYLQEEKMIYPEMIQGEGWGGRGRGVWPAGRPVLLFTLV